jgi:hypothetical protein
MGFAGCGRCHDCGTSLSTDEWCEPCHLFRRYHEHGWGAAGGKGGGRCFGVADTISHIFRFPARDDRRAPLVTFVTTEAQNRA